ncbi:hypothetical protein ES702_02478 [subsurface metagenome]
MDEEDKPKTIILEVTLPTKESIVAGIKQLFPVVEVKVIEEKPEEEKPEEPP